jgi:DNA-binding response OmpR family regulator
MVKTILIIDGELSIRKSFSSFFENEGYEVFLAEDEEVGLNKLILSSPISGCP